MNFYKKIYLLIYSLYFIPKGYTNNTFDVKKNILVKRFFQTLGVSTEIYYNFFNKILLFQQLDIESKVIANIKTIYNIKDKVFFVLKKAQEDVFININAYGLTNSEVKIIEESNLGDGTKNKRSFISVNIYGFLNIINKFDILNGYKPDFDILTLNNDENFNKKQHVLYYRMMGVNKKYNQEIYINDWRTYTMGDFIGLFGTPVYVIHSGNGEELFLYSGVHDCDDKRIIAFIFVQFDIYGKVLKYFHNIPLCSKCHKNYNNINLIEIIDLSNKK
jgi:hypothetical protein